MNEHDAMLPVLRPDVEVHPGPPAPDGSPTYTVHDPLNRTFDKVGWAEAAILERLRDETSLGELAEALAQGTTLRLAPADILAFCGEADAKGLTMSRIVRPVSELLDEREKHRIAPVRWLLHHYLYFRIPLVRPDAFLARTLPLVRPLASGGAGAVYALVALAGLVMCGERFDEYLGTFPYFFNWQGLAAFGLVVALIKIVHEFSHAYAAKAYGLRVPTMGVAFMVLWPVAYCDVTDAWKIADRRKRLAISCAGIKAELAMAGLALFGWGMTGPGLPHAILFVMSSSSLLSTLLVNMNPAMRFDGYFLLMDLWGIDNLQPRVFAAAKRLARRALLGVDEPDPDPETGERRGAGIMAYSLYTLVYRLALYAAIAVLVYEKFLKILGIFLFLVEVWWFILAPFVREARVLVGMRAKLTLNRRLLATAACLAALVLWGVLPLPQAADAPAVVVAPRNQIVYAPFSGVLEGVAHGKGARVRKGEVLSSIRSEKIDTDSRVYALENAMVEKKLEMYGLDERDRAYIPQLGEEIATVRAKLAGLSQQKEQSRQVAELDGTLYEWDETLRDGMAVAHQQVLGKIADLDDLAVYAFVREDRVMDLAPGDRAVFFPDGRPQPLAARIVAVHPARTEHMDYLGLTSAAKGSLPVVREGKGKFAVLESCYAVELRPEEPAQDLRIGQSGVAWLGDKARSRLVDGLRRVYRVLVRELNF